MLVIFSALNDLIKSATNIPSCHRHISPTSITNIDVDLQFINESHDLLLIFLDGYPFKALSPCEDKTIAPSYKISTIRMPGRTDCILRDLFLYIIMQIDPKILVSDDLTLFKVI